MATITGTSGDDVLLSENDGDEIFGLEGFDTLISTHNDVLLDGGVDGDTLITSGDNNTMVGGAGDDNFTSTETADGTIMDGGEGSDFMIGGGTNDTASYASETAGVMVNLNAFSADDGSGGLDTLLGIENVIGSGFNDDLRGDDFGGNALRGAGGNDVLFGGAGTDTFEYSFTFTPGEAEIFRFTDFFGARGGNVVNGEVADGTSMGEFSSSYAHWLKMLVKEEGLGTGDQRDLTQFGEPESFTAKAGNGKKAMTHEVSYFDTWTKGGSEDSVASNDGFDTILDFSMDDMLDFSGITEEQFLAHFNADSSGSAAGDASLNDTVITIDGVSNWSLTLADVSLTLTQVAGQTDFS
jgi:Ca2+-binding RTX toxin-like protein